MTVASATELVARLWHTAPPMVWTPGRSAATERTDLAMTLGQVASDADALAMAADGDERRAATLLAETARTIRAAFGTSGAVGAPSSATDAISGDGQALPSQLRLRLARMECWLAARAQTDRTAESAATLCLWALEHLEIEVR